MTALPAVALFRDIYLPLSETFIHDEIRAHRRWGVEVFARRRRNRHLFPAKIHLAWDERRPWTALGFLFSEATLFHPGFDREIGSGRFALLHAHMGWSAVHALWYQRRHRLPLVVSFHGRDAAALTGPERRSLSWWRYALLSGRILRGADLLLAASEDLKRLLLEAGAPAERVVVHRLGIDLTKFTPRAAPPPGPRTVVMIGRFVEKKGFEDGLRAFARAPAARDARLVLVGEGPLRGRYEEVIAALGIGARVSMPGPASHDEVARVVREAEVLLAPSVVARNNDRDSGLIVAKEASASAVPVIGTLHGGIPEIVDHGETGYLVPEHDPVALAGRLDALLADRPLRDRLGAAARAKMEREYDLWARVAELENHYDRLAGR